MKNVSKKTGFERDKNSPPPPEIEKKKNWKVL